MLLLALMLLLVACPTNTPDNTPDNAFDYSKARPELSEKATKRAKKLDKLFDNTKLGEATLTVTQDQWDEMNTNINISKYNAYVKSKFSYTKDGESYNMDEVGLRVRGNSTKRSPGTSPNYDQASFRVKFTEYHDEDDSPENKEMYHMEGSAKGINFKYMVSDKSYVQEIYSYDLFHRFGCWTAPRASYSKMYIKVGDTEKAYFGVYKAIEQINKQYIKARVGENAFSDDTGNLWKCLYQGTGPADLKNENLDGRIDEERWQPDAVNSWEKYFTPTYTLKTNDDTPEGKSAAETQLRTFISDLNSKTGSEFESWIATAFDVDGFLKTLAVNVAVGMWDDYWSNYNNYYLYFDGSGKCFFIPYDYDNCMGVDWGDQMSNPATKDPLKWGDHNDESNTPLVSKILAISKYKEQYKKYLKELIDPNKAYFDATKSKSRINGWYDLIRTAADKLTYDASYMCPKDGIDDWSISEGKPTADWSFLSDSNNYFVERTKTFKSALGM